ncbi:chemotaxis protein CheW, partial [Sulfurimonas sp.]|nr:chemotaxis protein CheW [Sulfurimonas sp.]
KIIVCEINNEKIGFVVDSVSDILNIKQEEIKEQDEELFSKVLHLDNGKRLVLSMDLDEVILQREA